MKNLILFVLLSLILLSCSTDTPGQDTLFSDVKSYIDRNSLSAIELKKVDVNYEGDQSTSREEVYRFEFTGTIEIHKSCYLIWNSSGGSEIPTFVASFEEYGSVTSPNYRYFKKGQTITYKGVTTYIKKKGNWEVLAY